ncbi:hypothetical protein, partial [Microbacterium bovistercoris]|uniref:hypothetical protein n=1 Tax=Microbacterium bovistercoris TaxID=2293570 RepID=UPI001C6E1DDF
DSIPFRLACRVSPPATEADMNVLSGYSNVPPELRELWSIGAESWLFEDIDYGQWGIHLLTPRSSLERTLVEIAERPGDFRAGDIVLGEFLGDSELLVFAPSESPERRWLVALPLDGREDWYSIGHNLADVFEQLLNSDGDKYWERANPTGAGSVAE